MRIIAITLIALWVPLGYAQKPAKDIFDFSEFIGQIDEEIRKADISTVHQLLDSKKRFVDENKELIGEKHWNQLSFLIGYQSHIAHLVAGDERSSQNKIKEIENYLYEAFTIDSSAYSESEIRELMALLFYRYGLPTPAWQVHHDKPEFEQ